MSRHAGLSMREISPCSDASGRPNAKFEFRIGDYTVSVSPEDAGLAEHHWSPHGPPQRVYFMRKLSGGESVQLHREVMGLAWGDPRAVDHRDGDTLNCQRSNLRIATASQNQANSRLSSRNTSGFKGVHRPKGERKWAAQLKLNGRRIDLGRHDDPETAARAYDEAARQHFGEYAALNFPGPNERGCRPEGQVPVGKQRWVRGESGDEMTVPVGRALLEMTAAALGPRSAAARALSQMNRAGPDALLFLSGSTFLVVDPHAAETSTVSPEES